MHANPLSFQSRSPIFRSKTCSLKKQQLIFFQRKNVLNPLPNFNYLTSCHKLFFRRQKTTTYCRRNNFWQDNYDFILELIKIFLAKTMTFDEYQTGQTFKHIKQYQITQDSVACGTSRISVRFEPNEIVPNLAPDLFGLLQAHLYMKFANENGLVWKRLEVQVQVC